ncbi:hypothetical protein K3172_13105 [Qipengyuania sp. 6B39]|nr:hypothetical protein [Qipengyuania proteolytica]MBX7496798.1 hypothetical protein [Qipengyuania proteolytica]
MVQQRQRGGIDHILRIVEQDHARLPARAPLVLAKRRIEPVQAIGLAGRPIDAVDHETHPCIPARCGHGRGQRLRVVAIATDVDPQLRKPPHRQHVVDRRPDDCRFLPRRDEDCRRTGELAGGKIVVSSLGCPDASPQSLPDVNKIDGELVEHADREKGCREQQKLAMHEQKPLAGSECDCVQPRYPLAGLVTKRQAPCNVSRIAQRALAR